MYSGLIKKYSSSNDNPEKFQHSKLNDSQLAKMKKSIPDMPLP